MRARHLLAALAGSALLACAVPQAALPQGGVERHMTCVAPSDAGAIDAMLERAGSPLAGEGATFVRAATRAGLDPRALVAIAAHETILETYAPAQAIRNPFGLGPGIAFTSERAAIERAAEVLGRYYLAEGRTTLAAIGAKWAPVGAANDPSGLNRHWTSGVGTYHAALGGDPDQPVLLADQAALPGCAGAPAAPDGPRPDGPPVVTAWGGAPPAPSRHGADPATGRPAVVEGFVFPLALPEGAPAAYRDAFAEPGATECAGARRQCAVTVAAEPGDPAVAMAAGTLRAASAPEQEAGVAFWIETPAGDRLGYGPLAAYEGGVADGRPVAAGQHLGAIAGWVRIAWERDGARIDPFPMLAATRPPAGG
ncbi:hypothetical protein [Miltoncostaea marina]|uniref:hypothetical protein n=1 Tax=Miltoncostaea marina TaxID=2843215 RepID=UPI001C3CF0FD|nr:hypothetical protein [Miltoncostaea marina]